MHGGGLVRYSFALLLLNAAADLEDFPLCATDSSSLGTGPAAYTTMEPLSLPGSQFS